MAWRLKSINAISIKQRGRVALKLFRRWAIIRGEGPSLLHRITVSGALLQLPSSSKLELTDASVLEDNVAIPLKD